MSLPGLLCLLADQRELEAGMAPPSAWWSTTEQARWASFSTDARRRSFLAGRWLARRAVQRWCGMDGLPELEVAPSGACRVAGLVTGQATGQAIAQAIAHVTGHETGQVTAQVTGEPANPMLDRSAVYVSISHHGSLVACAVAAMPVGVDIEGPRAHRDYLALAETVHSAAQCQALAGLPAPERERHFLRTWTLKEAWLKARQQGLDFALMRGLVFEEDSHGDVAVAEHGDVVLAIAADPALPPVIEAEPAMRWHRCRTRRTSTGPTGPAGLSGPAGSTGPSG